MNSTTEYKRYQRLNAALCVEDRERLESEYQACSVCGVEKRLIDFYPVDRDDRAGERCVECIICRDIRNKEEGAKRAALREKYGDLPVRQARKHERYALLLATATEADAFRLKTFTEACACCGVVKPWADFYPKDWDKVSQERAARCIQCEDTKA